MTDPTGDIRTGPDEEQIWCGLLQTRGRGTPAGVGERDGLGDEIGRMLVSLEHCTAWYPPHVVRWVISNCRVKFLLSLRNKNGSPTATVSVQGVNTPPYIGDDSQDTRRARCEPS